MRKPYNIALFLVFVGAVAAFFAIPPGNFLTVLLPARESLAPPAHRGPTPQLFESPLLVRDSEEATPSEKQASSTPAASSPSPPETTRPPARSFNEIDVWARRAAANIVCAIKKEERNRVRIRAISGSGVLVDPRGVVLTNAHVAQFMLLPAQHPEVGATKCTLRLSARPAQSYRAELIYLPPAWIARHASDIDTPEPRGTGEDDYAFLHITETAEGDPVSLPLPFIATDAHASTQKDGGVLIAGYPSRVETADLEEFGRTEAISTLAVIRSLFTFGSNTTDVVSLGGTALSYKGASGGAVVDDRGALVGLIVTSTEGETAAERDLRAITVRHINRSLKKYTGLDLTTLLSGDLAEKTRTFDQGTAPILRAQLLAELE